MEAWELTQLAGFAGGFLLGVLAAWSMYPKLRFVVIVGVVSCAVMLVVLHWAPKPDSDEPAADPTEGGAELWEWYPPDCAQDSVYCGDDDISVTPRSTVAPPATLPSDEEHSMEEAKPATTLWPAAILPASFALLSLLVASNEQRIISSGHYLLQ